MQSLSITSSAFESSELIPKKHTADGEDINPPINIKGIPDGTKSLVLIVDDPDAPMGTWIHWVVWNMQPRNRIDEDSAPGAQGRNSWNKNSYGGPDPPSGTHRYFFKVYALDAALNLEKTATKNDVEKAMKEHILAKGELVGLYHR